MSTEAVLLDPAARIRAVEPDPPEPPMVIKWAAALSEPLEPVDWLCEGLRLARGSYAAAAGESYSGKSLLFADMALSVAAGEPVLGLYRTQRGRVLWMDYDGQGERISRDRFQRLSRPRELDLRSLDQNLGYAWLPAVHLDDSDALDVFCRALDGIDLAIIDSWRGACPATDEHSRREVQQVGETIFRVCEKTGCAVLMIDHTIKPAREGQSTRSEYHNMHGSSAKAEMPQWLMMFSKQEGKPTKVRHSKERIGGRTIDPFSLGFEDVEQDGNPRWGLRVVHVGAEQEAEETERANASKARQLEDAIIAALKERPGTPGVEALAAAVRIRPATVRPTLALMKADGKVVNRGSERQPRLFVP